MFQNYFSVVEGKKNLTKWKRFSVFVVRRIWTFHHRFLEWAEGMSETNNMIEWKWEKPCQLTRAHTIRESRKRMPNRFSVNERENKKCCRCSGGGGALTVLHACDKVKPTKMPLLHFLMPNNVMCIRQGQQYTKVCRQIEGQKKKSNGKLSILM